MTETLDLIDIQILRELQKDAKLTTKELAAKVNLSPSPVFERQKRLEREGYIRKYIAVVDPIKAGNGIMVLCNVRLKHHSKEFSRQFTSVIAGIDEVVECFNTSWGKIDSKKYFKAPTMNDFIVIPKGDKTKKKTILEAIEFPIIYYSLNNDGTITARHSLKEYMSKEDFDKIAPYLKDEIIVNIKK